METRDGGGWRVVVYSVSVEGWTKRGFKLPRFISINTTVLCPTTDCRLLSTLLLGRREGGGWLLPLVGRRATTTGETNARKYRWLLACSCSRNFAYQLFVVVFHGEGGGRRSASAGWIDERR